MRGRCPQRTVALLSSRGFSLAHRLSGISFFPVVCPSALSLGTPWQLSRDGIRLLSVFNCNWKTAGARTQSILKMVTQCPRANLIVLQTCISTQPTPTLPPRPPPPCDHEAAKSLVQRLDYSMAASEKTLEIAKQVHLHLRLRVFSITTQRSWETC